jgi:uncharacterized protein YndB with AHSA1/START domain
MPAPPEDVYDEWLDPDALREWMCPRPAYATTVECDPRIGGELRLEIDDAGQPMTVTGRFLELRRPSRLRFTWYCSTWAATDAESVVTVTFEPHGRGETLMTIEHTSLRPDLLAQHENGWRAIADQLAAALSR